MMLSEKIVVITGGGRGIGKAIASRLGREGASLVLVSRTKSELKETEGEFISRGISVTTQCGTVTDEQFLASVADHVGETFGKIDVLVTAAGVYGPIGRVEDIDAAKWREAIDVNLTGTFLSVKAFLPLLKKSERGKIITFGGGGEGPYQRFSAYVASKGGVIRFAETIAAELKDFNIDANAILPGAVNTAFLDELLAQGPGRVGEETFNKSLQQKADGGVSPDKAAELAFFLASDRSDGITGKAISAVWDDYESFSTRMSELQASDVYTFRRVKPGRDNECFREN